MSSGLRNKFHGSKFYIQVGLDDDSPAPVVTGISQTSPPVVGYSGGDFEDGDVVMIDGAVGATEAQGKLFIITEVDSTSFALTDADGTGWSAWVSGGTIRKVEYSNFCELTSYNQQDGAAAEIDFTDACSVAKEFELDLPDYGTTALDYSFALKSGVQQKLNEYKKSSEKIAIRVELPNNSGVMVQLGYVQQTSASAATGGKWIGSTTIRNTGARVDLA